jgi:hypothetical protein
LAIIFSRRPFAGFQQRCSNVSDHIVQAAANRRFNTNLGTPEYYPFHPSLVLNQSLARAQRQIFLLTSFMLNGLILHRIKTNFIGDQLH